MFVCAAVLVLSCSSLLVWTFKYIRYWIVVGDGCCIYSQEEESCNYNRDAFLCFAREFRSLLLQFGFCVSELVLKAA